MNYLEYIGWGQMVRGRHGTEAHKGKLGLGTIHNTWSKGLTDNM